MTTTAPVRGKTFWLDGKIRRYERDLLRRRVEVLGGVVQDDVDASLDYLVLAEARRATPGKSQAEKAVAKLAGAAVTTLYQNDVHALLVPTRAEALALLRVGSAGSEAWLLALPPMGSGLRIDLSGADLRGFDLTGYRFYNCDLAGVRLDGAFLDKVWLHDVAGVDFRPAARVAYLNVNQSADCHFDGLDLSGRSVYGRHERSTFRGAVLKGAYLGGAAWDACDLTEADLAEARAGGWHANDLVAERANFTRANLNLAKLPAARLAGAVFAEADLAEATLSGADLTGADFRRALLLKADLTNANLTRADFRGANLAEADLTGANLDGADLTGANLRDARGVPGTAAPTAGPLLTQLAAALTGRWELDFDLDLPTGGRLPVGLSWGDRGTACLIVKDGRSSIVRVKDAATALLDLRATRPDAVPDVGSVVVKPAGLGKTVRVLACQALCETFGQPVPDAKDLARATKAAKAKAGADRDAVIARLRAGGAVADWNATWETTPVLDRKALADFKGADLAGADLREIQLYAATLRKANLRGADCRKARLRDVGAQEADAEGADLRGARLDNSTWTNANLRRADLREADASDDTIDLRGADLTGAKLVSLAVGTVLYDAATKLPAGFVPDGRWKNPSAPAEPEPAPARQDLDFAAFFDRLPGVADAGRVANAIGMLQAERFSLFAETTAEQVVGVVRSQSTPDRVYACRLTSNGQYECGTQNLRPCGGQRGAVCKHLLVLLLGLAKANALDPGTAFQWLQLAGRRRPGFDKEALTTTFLKYKAAEAGTVDWRPTETVPEDYYAL